MWGFLQNLKGKDMAMIITSVGGIVLAGFLAWSYFITASNHIDHSTAAILQQAVTNEKVSGSLDKLTAVLERKLK